ncbi:MAG TPA: phosphatidate cytidylyltransferase [Solirubrobacteraceae bacterium]|nr:phosphatidate cytidylyltransferase [Solirubrobacteraceae bacterium]
MATRSQTRASRARRRNQASDLGARVWIAVPAAVYAIGIIVAGGWVFALGILVLGLVCLHELFRLYEHVRPVKLAGFLGLIGLTAAAHFGGEHEVLIATVAVFPAVFLLGLLMPERDGAPLTAGIALTVMGALWVGLAIAHGVLLRESPHGDGIVVDVLVGTFIGDTAAYLGGRAFGTRRLAPRISPGKTVEGLVFGVLGATLAVWCAGLYQDWLAGWEALVLGAVVGVVAPIGDLFESKVKRDAGAKDAGTLFGAHGGALDRLDAALFTLVAGYYVWLALS